MGSPGEGNLSKKRKKRIHLSMTFDGDSEDQKKVMFSLNKGDATCPSGVKGPEGTEEGT